MPNEVTRYNCETEDCSTVDDIESYGVMRPDVDGDYVLYDDYKKLLNVLQHALDQAEALANLLKEK